MSNGKQRLYAHPNRPAARNNPANTGGEYGFFPAAGTNYSYGDEPALKTALTRLARSLHLRLTGLSGYRTPSHSVAVGGFANDPHTRGQASDTPGIENVSESTLNRFGLTRPFGGAKEANHIQLLQGKHSSTAAGPSSQQSVVNQAASSQGVPAYILTGVWGMETNYGQNVATSSAGAIGDFQFLPSTAKGRGYPLTNSPNAQQFAQQATAAAKYLRELFDQYGSWDEALRHYSGGGYGLKEVQNKAPRGRNFGGTSPTARTRPGGQAPGATEGPDVTSVLSDWSDAQSADPSANAGGGNQFASFPIFPGGIGILPSIPNPLDLFKNLSGSINSVTDFLKLLAWIINPINILRMVEVLVGFVLMTFGFQAMLQAYGERREGFVTSENALSRSGLGRVSREVASAVTTAVPEARAAKAAKGTKGAASVKSSKPTTGRVKKPRSAPHRSRREALRLRYEREETRRAKR